MKYKTQDPKFSIENNRLIGQSGEVPPDEPLFILRARDVNAVKTLLDYLRHCNESKVDGEHIQAIAIRLSDFVTFRRENPTRMKQPDTSIKQMEEGRL